MYDMQGETVHYDTDREELVIIDQTQLPAKTVIKKLSTPESIHTAIRRLEVRGAPAIGVATAIGISVLAARCTQTNHAAFVQEILENCAFLESARPTAVNLFWASAEMKKILNAKKACPISEIRAALRQKALQLHAGDIAVCKKIGQFGAELLKNCTAVLTHCNAGRLAAVKYGTALAPVYIAKEQGHSLHVYADETRPLLQGARLTCCELSNAGIETTLICDNMASYVMQNHLVDAVLVGCDRVAKNGDTANKIGTSSVAVLAKYYNIPFYVCAPFSSIDIQAQTGAQIPVEMRDGTEITDMWYEQRMAPQNIKTLNPAFDITDHSLITGFITEKGVLSPVDF